MAYKLFDKDGNIVLLKDLQNKGPWCEMGESFEGVFIKKYGDKLNLEINPEKKFNKYAIDLVNNGTQLLGDLKTQHTPFFQSLEKYGINPQHAVSFNNKDLLRYLKFYPDVEIYFWIVWLVTRFENGETIEVDPMEGVWKISLDKIKELVKSAPLHYYQQRIFDYNGNNKGSYILDLSNPSFQKVI